MRKISHEIISITTRRRGTSPFPFKNEELDNNRNHPAAEFINNLNTLVSR
jgi:hypothetical protein